MKSLSCRRPLSCNVLCLCSPYLAPQLEEFHEPRGQRQEYTGMTFFRINHASACSPLPFQHERGRICGQLGSPCQGQKKYICVVVRMCKDVWVCVILAIRPSPPHSFPLIPSACWAVSQGLCAPQIRRSPFVVRWWRFMSEEGIWLCII